MLKDKRFLAAILVALVVVVILDVRYFMNRGKRHAKPAQQVALHVATPRSVDPLAATAPSHAAEHPNSNRAAEKPSLSAARHVAAWHRDFPLSKNARNPFRAAAGTAKPGDKSTGHSTEEVNTGPVPHLGAIAVVDGKMLALIDGEPVVTDGSLGNMKVIYIGPDGVTLNQGGERWAETLPPLPADGVSVVRRH